MQLEINPSRACPERSRRSGGLAPSTSLRAGSGANEKASVFTEAFSFPSHKCRQPERSEGSQRCTERHECQPLPTAVILSAAKDPHEQVRAKPSKARPRLSLLKLSRVTKAIKTSTNNPTNLKAGCQPQPTTPTSCPVGHP